MGKRVVNFVLNSEADKDILRWLDRQDNKSAAIRAVIRAQIGNTGVTLGDVYQAVKDLERKVSSGIVVQAGGDDLAGGDEPPDVTAALDALANL